MGSQTTPVYLMKMGGGGEGDRKFGFNSRNRRDLEILHVSTDHTYCRAPSRNQKHKSRSSIQGDRRIIERVDLALRNISEDSETVWANRYRSRCFHVVPPGSKVCKLAPRSSSWMVDGFLFWVSTTVRLPSLCLYRPGVSQNHSEKMQNDTYYASLVIIWKFNRMKFKDVRARGAWNKVLILWVKLKDDIIPHPLHPGWLNLKFVYFLSEDTNEQSTQSCQVTQREVEH